MIDFVGEFSSFFFFGLCSGLGCCLEWTCESQIKSSIPKQSLGLMMLDGTYAKLL